MGNVGCGDPAPQPAQTILVETSNNASLQELRSRVDETAFQAVGDAAAVMQLQAGDLAQLDTLPVTHFDVSSGPALDVLPLPGPQEVALDPAQSSLLATLTEGLVPAQFLVTGVRPPKLAREVLSEQDLQLGLRLPGPSTVRVLSSQSRTEGTMLIWEATLEGGGEASIVSDGEGLSGLVRRADEAFSIASLGRGRQVIIRESPQRFRDHATPAETAPAPAAAPTAKPPTAKPPAGPQACADPAHEVRVLFAYSETLAKSGASIASEIALAVSDTNKAFTNSRVNARIVSAGTIPVNYVEDNALPYQRHRAVVMDRSDGIADDLPAARDAVDADAVILLVQSVVKNGELWCGDAGTVHPPADRAYAVTTLRCASANLSLAHEIGHLAGGRHDDDATSTPYSFGRGHVEVAHEWRTIMATESRCRICPRIPHWSNPLISYSGKKAVAVPTGIPGISEEARVWSLEARRLAHYRCGNGTS